ncbi:MAG: OmpA family protein, partial [Bacteroidaceae bacterium]
MKRLLILMSLVMGFSLANAQQSIMNPKLTDNVYIGVNGGANTNLAMNKFFPVNPTFGIRIGKDVT